jgi:predicted lipid-binding transport protein (Tim44 family)
MTFFKRWRTLMAVLAVAMAASFTMADFADARRGGSFGSRGSRTWMAPSTTPTAPRTTGPVERSMTPRTQQAEPTMASRPGAPAAARPGLFGGGFGGILGALAVGGLVGMLLGHGMGGFAGFLGLILQLGILALVVMMVLRFMAGRRQAATAGASPRPAPAPVGTDLFGRFLDRDGTMGGHDGATPVRAVGAIEPTDEIGISQKDLDTFERLLAKTQSAFGREDYSALREIATPEVVSYLSEELSQNATRGLRNQVDGVKLLQGDLAEAWRERDQDYATVAMRYESRDVMRDRQTGRVVEGDPDRPTEATELWTFVRPRNGDWKLAAIQEAQAA